MMRARWETGLRAAVGEILATAIDFRICDSCGASVHKLDMHKNRYAQYICRECRSSGIKAVGRKNLRYLVAKIPLLTLATIAGLMLVLVVLLLALLGSTMHSYSNGGMLEDLKSAVQSLNRMAHH